jgi:hypothetical protein
MKDGRICGNSPRLCLKRRSIKWRLFYPDPSRLRVPLTQLGSDRRPLQRGYQLEDADTGQTQDQDRRGYLLKGKFACSESLLILKGLVTRYNLEILKTIDASRSALELLLFLN